MRVMRQLFLTGTKVDALISSIVRPAGLSHAALNALAVIEAGGGPMPVGQVTSQMHITTATTTAVLDTLERKGYVRRIPDVADRRRVLVDITPQAQALLDELLPAVQVALNRALGDFDDATLQGLLDAVTEVDAAIGELPDALPAGRRRPPARLRRT